MTFAELFAEFFGYFTQFIPQRDVVPLYQAVVKFNTYSEDVVVIYGNSGHWYMSFFTEVWKVDLTSNCFKTGSQTLLTSDEYVLEIDLSITAHVFDPEKLCTTVDDEWSNFVSTQAEAGLAEWTLQHTYEDLLECIASPGENSLLDCINNRVVPRGIKIEDATPRQFCEIRKPLKVFGITNE